MSSSALTGKMGTSQITFFCICAVIVLGTITASAALGPAGIVLWLVAILLFVIPNMMITSELGTTYPAEGGTYEWIAQAFGSRMSTRAIYLYWLSNGIWMAANFIFLTGLITNIFFPALTPFQQTGITIFLIWATVGFINYKVEVGIWMTVTGAILKVIIMTTVGIGGIWYAIHHGVATSFTLDTMTPGAGAGIGFFSVIIYNVTGFELVACMGSMLKNPARTMPKAILFSSIVVIGLYIFSSVGVMLAIPYQDINLVSGITDAIAPIFGKGSGIVMLITVMFLSTILFDQVTWSMAPSRAAAEAAKAGCLPEIIGKWHSKYKTPYGANTTLGVIGTVIAIAAALFGSGDNADAFWSVFSFSSTCIISSYLLLYPSFIKLRLSDAGKHRPYRMPGGIITAWICTLLCVSFIAIAIILFIFPDILSWKVNWSHSAPVIIGMIIALTAGEIIIRRSEIQHARRQNKISETKITAN